MTSDRVKSVFVSGDNERELPVPHPKLGVIIPLANEEATVGQLLQRVLAQLGPLDRIFCVLDGKSRDRTMVLVRGVSSLDPRVVAVWAPENRCVVDAYFRGFREALAARCDWILEMDGGLSHCPEEIPRFLDALGKEADFAAGSRFIRGGSYQGRWSRRLLSRSGTLLANLLLGTRMKGMTSGFECFSRRALSLRSSSGAFGVVPISSRPRYGTCCMLGPGSRCPSHTATRALASGKQRSSNRSGSCFALPGKRAEHLGK
jgi:dolichol-phosphate mannosyltransferase